MKIPNFALVLMFAVGLFLTADTGYDTPSSLVTKGQRTNQQQKPSEIRFVVRCTLRWNRKRRVPSGNVE